MRKFIFSGSMISAVLGVRTALKETKNGPRDWALVLMWISWALTVAIAIARVLRKAREEELAELESREQDLQKR